MKITFLGTGTSTGVPAIGCGCKTCTSEDPKDRRMRSSILISTDDGMNIIIDTGPDFREQCLKHGITRVDAVLYTHAHMDHIAGLDDLRRFNSLTESPLPVYAVPHVMKSLKQVFGYAFSDTYTSANVPCLVPVEIPFLEPCQIKSFSFTPLPIDHGEEESTCFLFPDWAYCTDASGISADTERYLSGIPLFILGALRSRPHPKHFSFDQAARTVELLKPDKAFLTHIGHNVPHTEQKTIIPHENIEFAYDGLVVKTGNSDQWSDGRKTARP
ncbi:MBL fold metallo-hydrolase [Planctomycetota bacterium]